MGVQSRPLTRVYVDTSVVVALCDPEDDFHKASVRFADGLRNHVIPSLIGPPFHLEVAKAIERRGTEAALRLTGAVEKYDIKLGEVQDKSLWNLEIAYASSNVLRGKRTLDLLHYASAALLGCTHLASWDRRHFNSRTVKGINRVNASKGLTSLIVGDPFLIWRRLAIE